MQESPSNKYLSRLHEAVEEDSLSLVAIFKACTDALSALDAADFSPEARYHAQKRMKKFIQDVWSAIPNQYKPVVQDLVQHAMFPEVAEPSPLLEDNANEEVPVADPVTAVADHNELSDGAAGA